MFDLAGATFFAALRDAAQKQLGRDHPCFQAVEAAAANCEAASIAAAQSALNSLDPEVLNGLMEQTHKSLRENPAAVLDAWPGGGARH